MIRNDPHRASIESCETNDQIFRVMFLHLKEVILVNDDMDNVLDVVGDIRLHRH